MLNDIEIAKFNGYAFSCFLSKNIPLFDLLESFVFPDSSDLLESCWFEEGLDPWSEVFPEVILALLFLWFAEKQNPYTVELQWLEH